MSRFVTLTLCLGLVLPLLSCGQGASPIAPPVTASTEVGGLVSTARGSDLLLGYRIDVDEESLTATVTPHRAGAAQPPQAQRYDLDIANFQNADSFRITGVQVLGSGNFRITFSHAHPFPAPNIANPATGINRADLGYTGRLVILTSYNPKSYFTNSVRLSAGSVVAPDGYVEVGDLLANLGPQFVTAYPYKLLADESLDNRVGVSNSSNPLGTYAPTAGGWQRINLGASGTGWTGYDYLHGGQSITNTFVLDKDALAATNFGLDVALLIQYTDPRGAGGATFRLPPSIINSSDFAYRLPHAALDASKVTFTQNFTLDGESGASAPLEVRVRDWDATAGEAGDATLGDEGEEVDIVTAGASGAPEVVLDAPGILTSLRNMGAGTGSGLSNDPVLYANDVVNQEAAGEGEYFACLRITDPEFDDTERGSFHAGVDATTLLPDAARAVPARTWQIVPIIITAPPVISAVNPTGIVGAVDNFVTFTATASGSPTSFTWEFQGGVRGVPGNSEAVQVQLAGVPGLYQGSVTATNESGTSAPYPFTFRLLPPERPLFNQSVAYNSNILPSFPDDALITMLNGRPVVFFTYGNFGPTGADLWVAQANSPFPDAFEEWTIYEVAGGVAGSLSAATIGGRLAVAYPSSDLDSIGRYTYALVDAPVEAADWSETTFRSPAAGEDWGRRIALTNYGGLPAMVVREELTDLTYYFRASSAAPDNAADWAAHQVADDIDFVELVVCSFDAELRPMLVLGKATGAQLRVLGSDVAEPNDVTDWSGVSITIGDTLVNLNALAGVDGEDAKVHVVASKDTGELYYIGFRGVTAGGQQLFTRQPILGATPSTESYSALSITRLNERLALAYDDAAFARLGVVRALRTNPEGGDWDLAIVPTGTSTPRLGLVGYDNRLAGVADDGNFNFFYTNGPW